MAASRPYDTPARRFQLTYDVAARLALDHSYTLYVYLIDAVKIDKPYRNPRRPVIAWYAIKTTIAPMTATNIE